MIKTILPPGHIIEFMNYIDRIAKDNTTDPKVWVGALLGSVVNGEFKIVSEGFNANPHYNEKKLGHTYREFLFGSRDKKYRPWDKIIHAEENAVVNAIRRGQEGNYDTAIVTRYPCEKCAQLLVYKGVKTIYYGRRFEISQETEEIFSKAGVTVVHYKEYAGDDSDDNK